MAKRLVKAWLVQGSITRFLPCVDCGQDAGVRIPWYLISEVGVQPFTVRLFCESCCPPPDDLDDGTD